MSNQVLDQKRQEIETLCYKQFMKVAKKISYMQYGKWDIVPNINDPLRKFTLEKKSEWFTLRISLHMDQFYHRANYTDIRYDYRAVIVVSGMFSSGGKELMTSLGMKLRPRMARKLLAAVDEVVIPKFYKHVQEEVDRRQLVSNEAKTFADNINKIKGLQLTKSKNSWDSQVYGVLSNCPFEVKINKEDVQLSGSFNYDELAKLAEQMGWGK